MTHPIIYNVVDKELTDYFWKFAQSVEAQDEALEIFQNTATGGRRTEEDHLVDCIYGVVGELAAFKRLSTAGWKCERSAAWSPATAHIDGHLLSRPVDIKLKYRGGDRFEQTLNEKRLCEEHDDNILYICIEMVNEELMFRGERYFKDLRESSIGKGDYAYRDELQQLLGPNATTL